VRGGRGRGRVSIRGRAGRGSRVVGRGSAVGKRGTTIGTAMIPATTPPATIPATTHATLSPAPTHLAPAPTSATAPNIQQGRGEVDMPKQAGEEVRDVAAQTNSPPVQPPQDRLNSIPVVAAADLARRHVITRAYALGLPIPEIVAEVAE